MSDEDQKHWAKHIHKLIRSQVKLIADDGTTGNLTNKIKACQLAMTKGDTTGLIMYHFDVKKYA